MANLLNVIEFGEVTGKGGLFDGILLPNGIDKETLVNKIVYDNWDLQPKILDFDLLKKMIENHFKIRYTSYSKIFEALESEYNPLHNFDRYEVKDEDTHLNQDRTRSNTNTNTIVDSQETNGTDNTENLTSAYNSIAYQPREKTNNSFNNTTTTNTSTNALDSEKEQNEHTNKYTTNNHLYGNIGVTTSQQMLESEIKLRLENDIYTLICLDFRKEFMLLYL